MLYLFVLTGFRVDDEPPPRIQRGLFAPVFASIIVIVIVIDFLGFLFGNDNYRYLYRYRYRYRSRFGLFVPERF